MLPFLFPIISSSLQHGHILVNRVFLRVGNDNAVFQQAGGTDIPRLYNGLVNRRGRSLHQTVKARWCCRHTDDNRHGRKMILRASLQKLLHDSRSLARLTTMHATMRLINNNI